MTWASLQLTIWLVFGIGVLGVIGYLAIAELLDK